MKINAAPVSCALIVASLLDNGTHINPRNPATPCTEIAPTGSSILMRSKPTIENITTAPATKPMTPAINSDGDNGSAVMATKPARIPLSTIVRSALPQIILHTIRAEIAPQAAAVLVLTNTLATELAFAASESINCEPPLKPNHPIHKINIPKVAIGKLEPGIGFTCPLGPYFPLRGPNNNTPTIAAVAPVICTIPLPAKSTKPSLVINPCPHVQ